MSAAPNTAAATTAAAPSPPWANPAPVRSVQNPPVVEEVPAMSGSIGGNPSNGGTGGEVDGDFLTRPYSTLDEPVLETVMRDVRAVGQKLLVVLLPLDRQNPFGYAGVASSEEVATGENQRQVINKLREWDLWGPLIICLSLSVVLALRAKADQQSLVFAAVFVVIWVGAAAVTLNAQLLGGTISFFQSVCVLGYCVFPLTLAAFVIGIFAWTRVGKFWLFNIIWIVLGFVWATRASSVFIGQYIQKERRALAVYPVFFFYVVLGWIILLF